MLRVKDEQDLTFVKRYTVESATSENIEYEVTLGWDRSQQCQARCTCPDYEYQKHVRGQWCKHIDYVYPDWFGEWLDHGRMPTDPVDIHITINGKKVA
jgi:hypothetical protein